MDLLLCDFSHKKTAKIASKLSEIEQMLL